ncbi:unnamed protein product, partial [Heterotrigona itama]
CPRNFSRPNCRGKGTNSVPFPEFIGNFENTYPGLQINYTGN